MRRTPARTVHVAIPADPNEPLDPEVRALLFYAAANLTEVSPTALPGRLRFYGDLAGDGLGSYLALHPGARRQGVLVGGSPGEAREKFEVGPYRVGDLRGADLPLPIRWAIYQDALDVPTAVIPMRAGLAAWRERRTIRQIAEANLRAAHAVRPLARVLNAALARYYTAWERVGDDLAAEGLARHDLATEALSLIRQGRTLLDDRQRGRVDAHGYFRRQIDLYDQGCGVVTAALAADDAARQIDRLRAASASVYEPAAEVAERLRYVADARAELG